MIDDIATDAGLSADERIALVRLLGECATELRSAISPVPDDTVQGTVSAFDQVAASCKESIVERYGERGRRFIALAGDSGIVALMLALESTP